MAEIKTIETITNISQLKQLTMNAEAESFFDHQKKYFLAELVKSFHTLEAFAAFIAKIAADYSDQAYGGLTHEYWDFIVALDKFLELKNVEGDNKHE